MVSAASIASFITADMIEEGAAVMDVGINRVQDPITAKPTLIGSVDFKGVGKKAGYITPVLRAVGPMTTVMLMRNTITAATEVLMAEGCGVATS